MKKIKSNWLKPMFKWSGGKTRELPFIHSILPKINGKVIEPFVGGGAFFFSASRPSIINDNDESVINFYQVVKNKNLYPKLKLLIESSKKLTLPASLSKEECRITPGNLCSLYYEARDIVNSTTRQSDPVLWAHSFLVMRQLCFSGMHRMCNNKFNVPYGWYKELSTHLSDAHHQFLQNCSISLGSFEQVITNDLDDDDFIFIDPPYLNRAGYTDLSGSTSLDLHNILFEKVRNSKAKWMIIHCDDEFYRDTYKDFHIIENKFTYSQNFKGRETKNSKVSHLYISNYDTKNIISTHSFEEPRENQTFGNGLFTVG